MLSCRDVDAHLRSFLRGELAFDQRLSFHRHMAGCARCHGAVERARDAMDLSRAACSSAGDPMPADVPDPLLHAILAISRATR